jgi:GGDEF domain-containing protein
MLLSHVTSAALAVTGDSDRPITASIGIVSLAAAGEVAAPRLMELADQAMYSAKRLGKNRYAVA